MAAEIRNQFGKIVLAEDLIAEIAGMAAAENYGIVGLNSQKTTEVLNQMLKRKENLKKGIRVSNLGPEQVGIDLYVTLEYGVSFPAVAQNAQHNVTYRVQEMTGLTVSYVNIHVSGIRVQ